MGTQEEECSVFHEPQNEISDETCYAAEALDVDVNVEVVNVNADGDGSCVRETNVVAEESSLVEHLERVELDNNANDGSKIKEESREYYVQYDDEGKNRVHPLRPYAVDCSFYTKNGVCMYGQSCRYNHPRSLKEFQLVGDKEKRFEESVGSVGDARTIECKYFQTPGGCRYGDACRYNHRVYRIDKREHPKLNFLGLPVRPSAQECTYYLQTGSCAYGAQCKFNHPDPSPKNEVESENSQANGESVTGSIGLPRNSGGVTGVPLQSSGGMNPRNCPRYAPEISSYQQTISQTPKWNRNQVTNSFPANKFPLPHQVVTNVSKRVDPFPHYENPMQIEEFPERPDQPDCDYFMKTGDCKYKSACRYNHPKSQVTKLPRPPFSSNSFNSRPSLNANPNYTRKNGMSSAYHQNQQMQNGEFPERAGEPECEYYMKTGQCKFKSACRFDHPRSRLSTSSAYHQNQQMQKGEFPERAGEPECEYYMKTGQCKFKSACRFDHPRSRLSASSRCDLSENGLPLRPGAKICRYYEKQGTCKYGLNCLYDHPDYYPQDLPAVA